MIERPHPHLSCRILMWQDNLVEEIDAVPIQLPDTTMQQLVFHVCYLVAMLEPLLHNGQRIVSERAF